ncbi:MAG: DUF4914 family protein [Opitutae bacterium]|nr:DUF4914 family protein [Opitutae bacterium]
MREILLNRLPPDLAEVLRGCPEWIVAGSPAQLVELSLRDAVNGVHTVAYDVPGRGLVPEVEVCAGRNGISANYVESYMRRRDPDCMTIADDLPTDKPRFQDQFGYPFSALRTETLAWLKTQSLAVFLFQAGGMVDRLQVAVLPSNAGFFALGLALLQGLVAPDAVSDTAEIHGVIYVAPVFRHTHFKGRQMVVHHRSEDLYEMFSYNLYPGPSAKKGVYGMLLDRGERERWVTMHCSAVQVVTPYDNRLVISHEGASGGGKSEMLEQVHREEDGRLLFGANLVTGEEYHLVLPRGCLLRPVADDMALCRPLGENQDGKLHVRDAENAWFVRVNHIKRYGVDPALEQLCVNPPGPLLFLNIDTVPQSTALIWEHTQDKPGVPCPNPRVVIPRAYVPHVVHGETRVNVRSFGIRTPPCTRESPTYGIVGMFHILPPALAWLWRLVAPRGHDNPSVIQTEGMSSEGVGSYWPFATGRRVTQANLLLQQILETPRIRYKLCPNQHIGAWKTGFMPQWIMREYLARRGHARFREEQLLPARCPLLGWAPREVQVEGQHIEKFFFHVEAQPEVGEAAYDQGARQLAEFFHSELAPYLEPDLDPLGRRIIDCCLHGGSVVDYANLIVNPNAGRPEFLVAEGME